MVGACMELPAFNYCLNWDYVKEVVEKQTISVPVIKTPLKRAYQKHDSAYWTCKTAKAKRRQVLKLRTLYNASILGRASKMASSIYQRLPLRRHQRCYYRALVALCMELLKADLCEEDILTELKSLYYEGAPAKIESLPNKFQNAALGVINHPEGYHYFVTTVQRCFFAELEQSSVNRSIELRGFRFVDCLAKMVLCN
jgi:hypothetical protein